MTRVVVARENAHPFPGTFLVQGCLKMNPRRDELIIVMDSDYSRPIGFARDFQRNEETGEISFDIQLHEIYSDLPIKPENFAVSATSVESEESDGIRYVSEATLQGVNYLPWGGLPALPLNPERNVYQFEARIRYDIEKGEVVDDDGMLKSILHVRRSVLDRITRQGVIFELEKLGYTVLPPESSQDLQGH